LKLFQVKETDGSMGAEGQRGRGAEEQRSRGAEEQRSRGAEEQRGRGAEEQRSRGAEENSTYHLLPTTYHSPTQSSVLSTHYLALLEASFSLWQ
jgi:hypothetical protein